MKCEKRNEEFDRLKDEFEEISHEAKWNEGKEISKYMNELKYEKNIWKMENQNGSS